MSKTNTIQMKINGLIITINIQPDKSNPAPAEYCQNQNEAPDFDLDAVNNALFDATEEDHQKEDSEENNDHPFTSTYSESQPRSEPKGIVPAVIKEVKCNKSNAGNPQVTWTFEFVNNGLRTFARQYTMINGTDKNRYLTTNLKLLGVNCDSKEELEKVDYQDFVGQKVEIEVELKADRYWMAILKKVLD